MLATIYLPSEAAAQERYAAEELQAHLRQMTGRELPIAELPPAEGMPAILLGRAAAEPLLPGFDWAALQEDGVVVKTVGQSLLLAGPTPRATLYAVYQFLDQVLGCRWLTPDCTIIPQRQELEIGELDIVHVPQFRYREPFFSAVWDSGDWLARNRANNSMGKLEERHGGKWIYAGHFCHTFYALVPPERYFAEHPEYFSELNGKRAHLDAQLCLTNDDVLEIVCDRVRSWLAQDPGARIVSITQNDWNGWCTCEKCRAIDEAEGSPSGTMIRFVNRVAERLEGEFSHVYFDTFAYTYTVRPPKTIRPRKNVIIRLCHITPCCDAHPMAQCQQNRWFYEVLQQWGGIAPELFIWDYYNNFSHYFQPFPNLDAFAADLPLFAEHGVTGVFVQGDGIPPKGNGDMAELRAWVFTRMLWNPRQDAWALADEFLRLYYGPAAPHLREYLDLLHAPARVGGNHFHLYQELESPAVAGDAIPRYHAIFDAAEGAVGGDPVLLDRVQAARLPIEYVTWKRELHFTVQGNRYRPASNALEQQLRSFFDVAERHGVGALREGGVPLAEIKTLAEGYEIVTIERGELKAAVIPALGGRLVSLADGDVEWIHAGEPKQLDYPYAGGYEEYSEHQWRRPGCNEDYQVERHSADELVLFAVLRNTFTLRRAYRLEDGGLRITSTISNPTDERRIGCFRSMPEFAGPLDALTVRFQERDGSWRDAMPWQTLEDMSGSGWVEGSDMPWGACRLQHGGRSLTLQFDPAQMEKVLFDWERPLNLIRLGLYSKGFTLEPGESFTVEQLWSAD
jgi:hypothetical protein